MFTGIIETIGTICHSEMRDGNLSLQIAPEKLWDDVELGESIACNGTCLTVTAWDGARFQVDLSQETLAKTATKWQVNDVVNLERAMRASDRFGGHIVSGHVDGVGDILAIEPISGAYTITVRAPERLARYLIPKGSVTVDGVSLTVVDVGGAAGSSADLAPHEFTLWLVPHTLEVTTLQHWQVGTQVNLEADQLAKYLERLRAFDSQRTKL